MITKNQLIAVVNYLTEVEGMTEIYELSICNDFIVYWINNDFNLHKRKLSDIFEKLLTA